LKLQTTLQGPQRVQSVIQSLIFFDTVIARTEKFACARHNGLFGIGYSRGEPAPVRLE
jgi:hypothetical protein